ncbi:MAG: hypothetical protein LBL01_03610 [Bifidobacteriaceae bacterium]|nr:hypothetical protein [Bifidobacteriaceae bacterium]
MAEESYYDLIEVDPGAPPEAVEAALTKAQREWSRRRAQAADEGVRAKSVLVLRRLTEAREALLDPGRRAAYDGDLAGQTAMAPGPVGAPNPAGEPSPAGAASPAGQGGAASQAGAPSPHGAPDPAGAPSPAGPVGRGGAASQAGAPSPPGGPNPVGAASLAGPTSQGGAPSPSPGPADAAAVIERARNAAAAQDWRVARKSWTQATTLASADPLVWAELARVTLRVADQPGADKTELTDEALEAAHEAVRLAPGDAWAHWVLGQAQSASGNAAGARDAYAKVVELDPDNALARADLGRVMLAPLGQLEGLSELNRAAHALLSQAPDSADGKAVTEAYYANVGRLLGIGNAAGGPKTPAEALANATAILKLVPGDALAKEAEAFYGALSQFRASYGERQIAPAAAQGAAQALEQLRQLNRRGFALFGWDNAVAQAGQAARVQGAQALEQRRSQEAREAWQRAEAFRVRDAAVAAQARKVHNRSIAALVVALAGIFFYGLGPIVGFFIALSSIIPSRKFEPRLRPKVGAAWAAVVVFVLEVAFIVVVIIMLPNMIANMPVS